MRNKNAKVSNPNVFVTNSGERFQPIYDPKVNPDGTVDIVEVGKEDIKQLIESFRPTTDIAYIIKKLKQGDTSVLNSKTPMFGDFTQMPKTYAEAMQMVMDAERKFYDLPLDVRNKFDNDYRQWLAQSGSEDWAKKMNLVSNDVSSDDIVKESENNESKC